MPISISGTAMSAISTCCAMCAEMYSSAFVSSGDMNAADRKSQPTHHDTCCPRGTR